MTRPARGFALIEVLVALAVLAVSLGAALRVGENATDVFAASRTRLLADWVANDQLAELRARRPWPDVGVTEGMASEAGMDFRWRQAVTTTANAQFRRVSVSVFQAADGKEAAHLGEAIGFFWKGAR